MEDEWYSGDTSTAGGAIPVGGGHGASTVRGGYGDSFTPPTSNNGMMPGQVSTGAWLLGCCNVK